MNKEPEQKGAPAYSSWFEEMYDLTPDAALIQGLDGKILHANQPASLMFGMSREELTGRRVTDFMTPDCAEAWARDLKLHLAGKWKRISSAISTPDGRRVPVYANAYALSRRAGTTAIALHLEDSSVHLRMEQALLASRDEWEQSFDAISDCICLADRQWKILRANKTMQARFDPHVKDLIGQDIRALLGLDGDGKGNGEIRLSGEDAACSFFDRTVPFLPGCFIIVVYPLLEYNGRRRGAIVITRDITEQKRINSELQQNLMRIQQESKMAAIGRLASGIAHDFNNVLTSIMGCGTLILKGLADSDPLRKEVQQIFSASERAAALIRQLLDFSHNDPIEMREADINSVVEDLEPFLLSTLGDSISLSKRLAPGVNPVRLDLSRAEQVIMNLAINARDAMPGGGQLVIETSNVSLDDYFCRTHAPMKPGAYVLLAISDSGIGMPPEVMEHIFEPFFTTKGKGKGTGVGLPIVYGIVKQFGGFITCYSEVGTGTVFKVYLPAVLAPNRRAAPRAEAAPPPAEGGAETLLVVDDEPNIVSMVKQLLSAKGYSVLATHSSMEAVGIAKSHPGRIHLAIMDVSMPEMGGKELLAHLRKDRPDIRAMFMSGYGSQSVLQNGLMDPGTCFIQKPFTIETLARQIRAALDS